MTHRPTTGNTVARYRFDPDRPTVYRAMYADGTYGPDRELRTLAEADYMEHETHAQTLERVAREAGILALSRDYIRTQQLLDIQTRAVTHELHVWTDCYRMSDHPAPEDAAGKHVHAMPVYAEWRRLHAHNKSVNLQMFALLGHLSLDRQLRFLNNLDTIADGGR